MKLLSLASLALMFCLFAGAKQTSAADSVSGTSYNFSPTDYSRGEARVVKTSLPPAPSPAPSYHGFSGPGWKHLLLFGVMIVVVVGVALLVVAIL